MIEFPVRVEQHGPFAVWTIERELRRNALSRPTLLALGRLARQAATDRSIRAVVVTGAGDKAFCAGADLKERLGMTENEVRGQLDLYRSELGLLDRYPKPVVAAVNGVASGGGLELALCCDFRIAVPHATFAMPETSLGVIPAAGGTQRLPRLIGSSRAKELILLGRVLNADEALLWGLVNRLSSPGQSAVAAALEWLTPIVDGAPIAQMAALEAIDRADDMTLEVGLALEKVSYEKPLVSEDRREALAAFAEKRKPVFQGK